MSLEIHDNGDAFDAAIALYYWLSHWHCGQFSDEYKAMCKITGEYKLENIPDIDFEDTDDDENFNTRMIYEELDDSNWQEYFDSFCEYMDNKWELN